MKTRLIGFGAVGASCGNESDKCYLISLWPLDHVTFRLVAILEQKLGFNVENDQVKGLSLIHDGRGIDLVRGSRLFLAMRIRRNP